VRTGKSVEEWMDLRVTVGSLREGGEGGWFGCTLEGVDESGVVLSYEKDAQKMIRFYPWHAVLYVQLAESGDEDSPRRPAGFSSA